MTNLTHRKTGLSLHVLKIQAAISSFALTLCLACGILAVYGFTAAPARASGDYEVPVIYSLNLDQRIGWWASDSVPFLSPLNDSRITLMLLLSDALSVRPRLSGEFWNMPVTPYSAETPLSRSLMAVVFDDKTPNTEGTEDGDAITYGFQDICQSDARGATNFLRELNNSDAPAPEKQSLTDARHALTNLCALKTKDTPKLPEAIQSASGKEFAAYLGAAIAFYTHHFEAARNGFASLANSKQAWLKESAAYMVARTALNQTQQNAFGDYGESDPDAIYRAALAAADKGLRAYLRDYPKGSYAASARGLLRRTAWLSGDWKRKEHEIAQTFTLTDPAMRNVSIGDLADEIDNTFISSEISWLKCDSDSSGNDCSPERIDVQDPRLLATIDLMLMRRPPSSPETKKRPPAPLTREALEAQRANFADQQALFNYLLAAYAFYVENNPAATLKLLNPAKPQSGMTQVQFSAQILKGLALDASKQTRAARAHWRALIPLAEPVLQRPAAELGLAQHYERSGDISAVFAPDSPILNPTYREILLTNSAGPKLLRQRAKATDATMRERQLALYVLLFKELTYGNYQAFLDDTHLIPSVEPLMRKDKNAYAYNKLGSRDESPAFEDFDWSGKSSENTIACPSLRDIATALARNPRAERSLICLSVFLRENNYNGFLTGFHTEITGWHDASTPPLPAQLGNVTHQFPGKGRSPLDIYKVIIANPKADKDARARALYGAVKCWEVNYNHCDSTDAPLSQRRQWFRELKTRYPDSVWASDLKYYW